MSQNRDELPRSNVEVATEKQNDTTMKKGHQRHHGEFQDVFWPDSALLIGIRDFRSLSFCPTF
jgi:hypothetical protein